MKINKLWYLTLAFICGAWAVACLVNYYIKGGWFYILLSFLFCLIGSINLYAKERLCP